MVLTGEERAGGREGGGRGLLCGTVPPVVPVLGYREHPPCGTFPLGPPPPAGPPEQKGPPGSGAPPVLSAFFFVFVLTGALTWSPGGPPRQCPALRYSDNLRSGGTGGGRGATGRDWT